jgi:hypothetical protein
LRWVYFKNADLTNGRDAGWLDQVSVTPILAPVFVTRPEDAVVPVGASLTLTSEALGIQPLSYQWFHDSAPVLNATNATLLLPNASATNAGLYCVAATNASGRTQSVSVSVIVVPPESLAPTGLGGRGELPAECAVAPVAQSSRPGRELHLHLQFPDANQPGLHG